MFQLWNENFWTKKKAPSLEKSQNETQSTTQNEIKNQQSLKPSNKPTSNNKEELEKIIKSFKDTFSKIFQFSKNIGKRNEADDDYDEIPIYAPSPIFPDEEKQYIPLMKMKMRPPHALFREGQYLNFANEVIEFKQLSVKRINQNSFRTDYERVNPQGNLFKSYNVMQQKSMLMEPLKLRNHTQLKRYLIQMDKKLQEGQIGFDIQCLTQDKCIFWKFWDN